MVNTSITRRTFFDWFIRGGVCAALGYPILIEPNWPVLEKIDVPITGLSQRLDGLKIGLLADFIKGFDSWIPLQLSGHSHGGQVILPFIGPPILPPFGKLYPMGLKRVAGTDRWVYTTRGIGNIIPIRFNCKPEVTLLTLRQ